VTERTPAVRSIRQVRAAAQLAERAAAEPPFSLVRVARQPAAELAVRPVERAVRPVERAVRPAERAVRPAGLALEGVALEAAPAAAPVVVVVVAPPRLGQAARLVEVPAGPGRSPVTPMGQC